MGMRVIDAYTRILYVLSTCVGVIIIISSSGSSYTASGVNSCVSNGSGLASRFLNLKILIDTSS